MRFRRSLRLALALSLALAVAGCAWAGDTTVPPVRVLFIGNSYTEFNAGIDGDLHGLAPQTVTGRAAEGGATLESHLANPHTLDLLDDGWDYVVLQEQSQRSVYDFNGFANATTALAAKVRALKGRPYLLVTWARPDSKGVTTSALRKAGESVARSASMSVILAGSAFADSQIKRPAIVLNQRDGHPTREGTYLAACTVFATIFGKSPVGNTFTSGLDADVAAHLQRVAATAAGSKRPQSRAKVRTKLLNTRCWRPSTAEP